IALPLVDVWILLYLIARLVKDAKWKPRLFALGKLLPALTLSVTALIMLDNFSYTVFKFGIVSTSGVWRAAYALGFLIFLWQAWRFIGRTIQKRPKKYASFLSLGLLTVSIAVILITNLSNDSSLGNLTTQYRKASTNRPNIIILGSDGLSASYLSAYGYTQDTTPFLSQIMGTSLVAENAFPNASSTTASTTSVLTGKEPTTVKVYRYPDILSGQDSFEHLPGILKQYGYEAVEIGTPYYVDAEKLNLLDGFDVVNSQSLNLPALDLLRSVLGNTPSTYFIWTMVERASERLLHIFFL
ncbi:MAG: sulfatase-like hydrolase/transferase, partial [Anaerolineales bacterium]